MKVLERINLKFRSKIENNFAPVFYLTFWEFYSMLSISFNSFLTNLYIKY
jgi:hypothetical protein